MAPNPTENLPAEASLDVTEALEGFDLLRRRQQGLVRLRARVRCHQPRLLTQALDGRGL